MDFRIPDAISDDDVGMDGDGLRKVAEMIAGTALGAGILAAGAYLYRRLAQTAGGEQNLSDLY